MKRHGLTVGVLLALMAAVPMPHAHADAGRVGEIDCEPSPAELEDIGFIAEQRGMPLEEAIARYGWQSCFVEVANYLQDAYPGQYSGAAITEGGRGAWIAFKGDVPEEAAALVEAIPVTVQLIGGRAFSEAEINDAFLAIYYDILGHENVAAASGGYDIETGVITIQAQPRDGLEDPAQRARLREELQAKQPDNTTITLEVIIVDALGGSDDTAAGQTGGTPSPAVYAGMLAAAVLALLAGLLVRRRRRRAPRLPKPTGSAIAAGLLLVAVLSGCVQQEGFRETPTQPPILVERSRGAYGDGNLTGRLHSSDDGSCLFLELDSGELSVVIWPRGSLPANVGGALVGVRVPGFGLVRVGSVVTGGGGYATIGPGRPDLPAVPDACPSGIETFAVLSSVSSAE